jgi:hypothetical protein
VIIRDLIQELNKYPGDAKVLVTWESIFRHIDGEHIFRAPNGIVVIDADDNCSKNNILSGELVPNDGEWEEE